MAAKERKEHEGFVFVAPFKSDDFDASSQRSSEFFVIFAFFRGINRFAKSQELCHGQLCRTARLENSSCIAQFGPCVAVWR